MSFTLQKLHAPNGLDHAHHRVITLAALEHDTLNPLEIVQVLSTNEWYQVTKEITAKPTESRNTGASVSYYKVPIENPTTAKEPYVAECNDIIEALGMTYAEGNIFKSIWRKCAARTLDLQKNNYDEGLYDAEKAQFFSNRLVQQEQSK